MENPTMFYKAAPAGVGVQVNADLWVETVTAEAGECPEGYVDTLEAAAADETPKRRGRPPKAE